jgi:hypothetical protein
MMNTSDLIYQESQILPENLRTEVLDFIGYLKNRYAINAERIDTETNSQHETALLSESVLATDWNRPEEDEAWAKFQSL